MPFLSIYLRFNVFTYLGSKNFNNVNQNTENQKNNILKKELKKFKLLELV